MCFFIIIMYYSNNEMYVYLALMHAFLDHKSINLLDSDSFLLTSLYLCLKTSFDIEI